MCEKSTKDDVYILYGFNDLFDTYKRKRPARMCRPLSQLYEIVIVEYNRS